MQKPTEKKKKKKISLLKYPNRRNTRECDLHGSLFVTVTNVPHRHRQFLAEIPGLVEHAIFGHGRTRKPEGLQTGQPLQEPPPLLLGTVDAGYILHILVSRSLDPRSLIPMNRSILMMPADQSRIILRWQDVVVLRFFSVSTPHRVYPSCIQNAGRHR